MSVTNKLQNTPWRSLSGDNLIDMQEESLGLFGQCLATVLTTTNTNTKKPKQIKTHPTFIYLLNGIQLGKVSGLFLQLENLLNRTGQQRCLCEV